MLARTDNLWTSVKLLIINFEYYSIYCRYNNVWNCRYTSIFVTLIIQLFWISIDRAQSVGYTTDLKVLDKRQRLWHTNLVPTYPRPSNDKIFPLFFSFIRWNTKKSKIPIDEITYGFVTLQRVNSLFKLFSDFAVL